MKQKLKRTDFIEELMPPKTIISIGHRNDGWARKVQEWLNLHRFHTPLFNQVVVIDDWYGNATVEAVKEFQLLKNIKVTGQVCGITWLVLVNPMVVGFLPITPLKGSTLQYMLVAYMNQLCEQHPTEVNKNEGPWVRSFMKGQDGHWAAWCNGVVSTALDHACESLNIDMDSIIQWSWSCERTKQFAIKQDNKSTYYTPENVKNGEVIPEKGDLFLVVRKSNDKANHIGVIENVKDGVMSCIEGNTNNEGSREGYELCKRKRNLSNGNYGIIKFN